MKRQRSLVGLNLWHTWLLVEIRTICMQPWLQALDRDMLSLVSRTDREEQRPHLPQKMYLRSLDVWCRCMRRPAVVGPAILPKYVRVFRNDKSHRHLVQIVDIDVSHRRVRFIRVWPRPSPAGSLGTWISRDDLIPFVPNDPDDGYALIGRMLQQDRDALK